MVYGCFMTCNVFLAGNIEVSLEWQCFTAELITYILCEWDAPECSEPLYLVCLFIIILILWQSCTESNTKVVKRSQQATGSNRKHTEASGSVRKLQEVSGSSSKPQEASGRQNNKIIINKQTKYRGSESHR